MAITRHATGNSKPRVFAVVDTAPTAARKKKSGVKKTTGGRVTKKAPAKKTGTTKARKPTVTDKVKGAAKKVAGAIERKPGKKAAGTAKIRGTDGKKKA